MRYLLYITQKINLTPTSNKNTRQVE